MCRRLSLSRKICLLRSAASIPCSSLFPAAPIPRISLGLRIKSWATVLSPSPRSPRVFLATIVSKPKISSLSTGVRHQFIETRELENPLYVANNADRCYHCKDELFDQMDSLARSRQFAAIAYGINADDTRDFRPGHRAAHEHHVLAPLLDAELTKSEIRFLSQRAGLSTWNRPASACLSSRVPYGTAVTPELLDKIDRAEAVLRALDFRQFRVRAHGELARIEIALDELPRGFDPAISQKISDGVKSAGFSFVTLDLEGYRQGSFNSVLKLK